MKNKVTNIEKAMAHVKDGMSVMVSGFNTSGKPHTLVEYLRTKTEVKDLHLICIDTGNVSEPLELMLEEGKFTRVTGTYFGTNMEISRRINEGIIDYELVPMGTFLERIRAAGGGLGGILTPTGVGTLVEEGKQKINVDGREYLLEKPIFADVALIKAEIADESGNLYLKGTSKTTVKVMATAAKHVIAQAYKIVKTGEIDPELVSVPSIYVDDVVLVESDTHLGLQR